MIFVTSFVGILAAPWLLLIPLFLLEGLIGRHIEMTTDLIEIFIFYDLIMGTFLLLRYIMDKIGGKR